MWPWYSLNWWPGCYDYAICTGDTYADYVCAMAPYGEATSANAASANDAPAEAAAPPAVNQDAAASTSQFYEQALSAFRQGSYRDATRLALHAAVDEPKNPSVHLLLLLGMFASGEYRGAAIEAHTVAMLGKTPDWPTLYAVYGNVDPYTEHLRALEKYRRQESEGAGRTFPVGLPVYDGRPSGRGPARALEALKLTPRDRLTAQLLVSQGGKVPDDIAKQLAELPPLGKAGLPEPPKPQPPEPPATKSAP